jgi:hypothetical protein
MHECATRKSIPNFHVFKEWQFWRNFIKRCQSSTTTAMQQWAWMLGILFDRKLSHFINTVNAKGGFSSLNHHLLILDGHDSHVTIDVVEKDTKVGLDLLTLSSYISHALQLLDVSIFKPFEGACRQYIDVWTIASKAKVFHKEVLA